MREVQLDDLTMGDTVSIEKKDGTTTLGRFLGIAKRRKPSNEYGIVIDVALNSSLFIDTRDVAGVREIAMDDLPDSFWNDPHAFWLH